MEAEYIVRAAYRTESDHELRKLVQSPLDLAQFSHTYTYACIRTYLKPNAQFSFRFNLF